MSDLNPTAASLLGFLHDGPQTGWQLVATVEQQIGPFWSLTRSQVYRELAALDHSGLVTAGPAGRRDARPYTITAPGRVAFSQWASRGPQEATIRLPLLLFVTLGRHVGPGVLLPMLQDQRRHHAELLRSYLQMGPEAERAGADMFQLATLDYGIATARATVRWLDRWCAELTREIDGEKDET